MDRVLGLELAADDYMSKPFGIHGLRARIKVIAKRCIKKSTPAYNQYSYFMISDIKIYPNKLKDKRDYKQIEFTLREIKILTCF